MKIYNHANNICAYNIHTYNHYLLNNIMVCMYRVNTTNYYDSVRLGTVRISWESLA